MPAWWWSRRGHRRVRFSSLAALPDGGATWRTRIAWLPDVLVALAVVALAVALAGPRVGDENQRVRRDGIALMMALDTSSSMRALDLASGGAEQTRLDAVKAVRGSSPAAASWVAPTTPSASSSRLRRTFSPLTLDHGNLTPLRAGSTSRPRASRTAPPSATAWRWRSSACARTQRPRRSRSCSPTASRPPAR
ncbi:MAG: BatA domain-containing protein [Kofleriaceae bacterium]